MGQKSSKTSSARKTSVVSKPNIDKKRKTVDNDGHSNHRSLPQCRIKTVENFVVIWIDSSIDETNENTQNSINHLRRIVNSIQTFNDIDQCVDYITNVKIEKVFVIVSGSLAQRVVPLIVGQSQLASIYVFCGDKQKHQRWASNFNKVKGLFTNIEDLCNQLKLDVRQSDNELTPISIISSSSTTDLNELDPSFMYSQLLKEILLENQSTPQEKKELVDFCRLHYTDNNQELVVIDEFERKYPRPSLIWWYTRECFLYPMLNKAPRTQDIQMIIKMGFVVRDLHRHIEQLHAEQNHQQSLTVYRGQAMSNAEFDKTKKSKGGLLAFNNFLSTSMDRSVSLNFARGSRDNSDLTAVLFQITIDPNISTTPFASVDKVGYFEGQEKEILFSMHTVFRIGETKQIEQRLFQIDLALTNDNDPQLTQLTQYMRHATRGSTGLHRMGLLMLFMSQLDKSEVIYTTLIEATADDDRQQLAHLHHQLGLVNDEKGDLSGALSHYQQSLNIKLTCLSSDDPLLSTTYGNIGTILYQQDDLEGALQHHKRALNIDLHAPEPEPLKIATDHNNIGLVFSGQGKYDAALQSFTHTVEIQLVHLPPRHPNLATTYNNIAGAYRQKGDNSKALSFLQKTLDIEQRSLPPYHSSLAVSQHNLAMVLDALHRTAEAIEHAERAVDILRRTLPPNHPHMKACQEHLDELRGKV
jgi:tetratricopeptide (TPR) repeat protein